MQLTSHQEEKKKEIFDHLKAGHKRILLIGSAGVGKTVLASEVTKELQRNNTINPDYNNGAIYVTAPTNKALAVLKGKVNVSAEFKTIHAALNMVLYTNPKSGQRKFVRGYSGKKEKGTEFEFCKACIIDECSMLNTEILEFLADYNFPIIFIGDNKQINPVGEEESPVFNQGYPVVELTEIIRQGAGNPIIELSRDMDMIYFKTPKLINGKGYTYSDAKNSIIDGLAEVNGTDDMKYLAYTNGDTDAMNIAVRERRYGAPKRIEKDETIVFNTPYEGGFYTNKEVKVEQVELITSNLPVPRRDTKFDRMDKMVGETDSIKLKYYRVNDAFNVIHEQSDAIHKTITNTLKDNCKKYGWNWKGFYAFAAMFADIKYNHAITIHKSQGSTYKETIINIGNININQKIKEKERLLYTAITRASDLIILNNV